VTIFARVKLNAEVPMDLSGVYFVGGSPANENFSWRSPMVVS
jgi:hypothetical protein